MNDKIDIVLEQGETFHMDVFKRVEKSLLPEFKQSMEPQKFRLDETPYLSELEVVLKEATNRPVSVLNKHRNFLQNVLQHVFFPLLLPLLLAWNCFRQGWIKFLTTLYSSPSPFLKPLNSSPKFPSPLLFPTWYSSQHGSLDIIGKTILLSPFLFSTLYSSPKPWYSLALFTTWYSSPNRLDKLSLPVGNKELYTPLALGISTAGTGFRTPACRPCSWLSRSSWLCHWFPWPFLSGGSSQTTLRSPAFYRYLDKGDIFISKRLQENTSIS